MRIRSYFTAQRAVVLILLAVCLGNTAAYKSCSSQTIRDKAVAGTDDVGHAIDAAIDINQDLYRAGKVEKDRARSNNEAISVANKAAKTAGQKVLDWVNEVDAQKAAAKARGETWVEPTGIPDDVRQEVRRLFDIVTSTLQTVGEGMDNKLVQQIAQILRLVNQFYVLFS